MLAAGAYGLAAAAAVESIDDSGRTVRLAQPARRIVALAPHLTELLFVAGAGNALVGVAAYSDYPPAARAVARIGDAHALDLERIVALRPDLVVAWTSGSPQRQLDRLRALGLTVFDNEPTDLDAIARAIERLGALAGTEEVARSRAARFRADLARIRATYAHGPPIRVFYQVAERPLVSVSRGHVIADALRACGAVSIFAGARDRLPRPSREAVLLADPDAIIVAADPDDGDPFALWQPWQSLRAVTQGRLYRVDPSLLHRPTPRILTGIEALCRDIADVRANR